MPRRAAAAVVADQIGNVGRAVWNVVRVLAKLLVLVGLMVALVGGGKILIGTIVASPHFALSRIDVVGTARVPEAEVLALAGVVPGDRLLSIDTDAVAERLATEHPWVAEARVSRRLPSVLSIEITERRPAAVVNLGGLYLIDAAGRPFKRAAAAEAVGLPVITGLERSQYVDHPDATLAAFREALAIVGQWNEKAGRPPLSEVNVQPRHGFTIFLAESGAEIRFGRGQYDRKLARLDQILEALKGRGGAESVRVVHLDGSSGNRIPVRLATDATETQPSH